MKKYQGFIQVEEKISDILKPLLSKKKNNFAVINGLNKAWMNIIGEKFQQFCAPKDVKFSKNQKNNGTLIITAYNPSTAFYLEANSSQIIERIAVYYGYKVISEIRIYQEPKDIKFGKTEDKTKISPYQQLLIDQSTSQINDPELQLILSKLGRTILGEKK
jgi:hypothetical protein